MMKDLDHLEGEWDADVLDPDTPIGDIDAEIRTAGGDPEAIAARGRTLARQAVPESGGAQVLQFPSWVRDWQIAHAAASGVGAEATAALEVELHRSRHPVTLTLRPEFSGGDDGCIVVEWAVEAYHDRGWQLLIYRSVEGPPQPLFLGYESSGTRMVTAEELGFDPIRTPLAYVFAPR